MIPLTLAEVAELVGGHLDATDGTPVAREVVLDSRQAGPESLFVALPGEQVDGHDFAATAKAVGVLAARPVGVPAVLVDDVRAALGRLAHGVLDRLPEVTVIGVTGSAGKTTTKDLLAALLSRLGPTVAPPGSFNNELGLPLTVLRCDSATRFLVLEYGARGAGHIRALTEIARPHVAVVLNVGSAHVGEFGSRAAIAQAKAELVEALGRPPGAPPVAPGEPATMDLDHLAVLNGDDPLVVDMGRHAQGRALVLRFGLRERDDVRARDLAVDHLGRTSFVLDHGPWDTPGTVVHLRLVGEHQVGNGLAAAAVALEFGLGVEEVAEVLSTTGPASPHRMAVTERADGVTVVDDSYNASPEAMRAALKALVAMTRPTGRRGVAVLGEMRELGAVAAQEHADIGELVVRLNIGLVVTVGDPSTPIGRLHAGAVLEGSWGGEAVHADTVEAARDYLRGELRAGDVVLVKASRAAGLDRLVEALLAEPSAPVARVAS